MGDAGITGERRSRQEVIGCGIDAIGWDEALEAVLGWASRRESRYVCHCNVHSVVTARLDSRFQRVLNDADMATPDGMPIAWVLRRFGFKQQPRISGPDMMWKYCAQAAEAGQKIYLYGGTPETLRLLTKRLLAAFPGLKIVGTESPPFREPTPREKQEVADRINRSGANVVFVGLGCPRQEYWMAANRGSIHAVMLGVGAAFDYHAGTVKRARPWMREHGLEWLHRMIVEPRRLLGRYIVTNTLFAIYIAPYFFRHVFVPRALETIRRLSLLLFALFPSFVKVLLLRAWGHDIGKNVHIGMSYLDIRRMVLKDGARIGAFNYFNGLTELVVMEHARIGGWGNWFTASRRDYQGNPGHGRIFIGRGSAMTNRHYIDVQESFVVGEQSFIGGFGSVFYTHGVSPSLGNFNRPVVIGDHCYLGSHCLLLPGARIGPYCFVGAGAVVTKDFSDRSHVLLAGNPAVAKKRYDMDAKYFTEDHTSFLPRPAPVRDAAHGA